MTSTLGNIFRLARAGIVLAQHGVRFGQLRIDVERPRRQFARPRHRLPCWDAADGCERKMVICEADVRQRKLRIERERLLQTLAAALRGLTRELCH